MRSRRLHLFVACTLLLAELPIAVAAPKAPAKGAPSSAPAKPKTLAERLPPDARTHFDAAVLLFEDKKFDGALVEFQAAYELSKEPRVLRNVAVCNKFLGRYTVAIALLQQELAEAKDLEPEVRTKIEDEIATLTPLTVVVSVTVNEADAEVFVDDRLLGKGSLAEARVDVGERLFRASKPGFPDATQKLSIVSGNKPKVTLELKKAPVAVGPAMLRVVEKTGKTVEVILDGAVVGKTPWQGAVVPGTHTLGLRGPDDTGAEKRAVTAEGGKTVEVTLESVPLPVFLIISATPSGASITIDGKPAGTAPYRAGLAKGNHTVVVSADGFREASREVSLASPDQPQSLQIDLERWRRWNLDFVNAFWPGGLNLQKYANEKETASSFAFSGLLGLRVGYLLTSNFGVEVLGGGFLSREAVRRDLRLAPVGKPSEIYDNPVHGERLVNAALLVGLGASVHFGESTPLTLRLSGGVAVGNTNVSDDSPGQTFTAAAGASEQKFRMDDSSRSWTAPFLAPEIRVGLRFGRAFTLDLGVLAMVLVLPPIELDAGSVAGHVITEDTRFVTKSKVVATRIMPTLTYHFDL